MKREIFRRLPMMLLLLAVGYYAAGCVAAPNPNAQPTPTAPPVPTLESEQVSLAINQYYIEMAGVTPNATGEFSTTHGTRVNWFNFSNFTFNSEAGKKLYDYLVSLVSSGLKTSMIYQGRNLPANLYDRAKNTKTSGTHKLFIVEDGAKRPSIVPGAGFPSGLSLRDGGDVPASFVQTRGRSPAPAFNLADPTISTSASIVTEACHNIGIAGSSTTPLADVAQEALCNSIGIAHAAKVQNISYSEYAAMAKRLRLGTFQVDVIALDRQDYDRMPNQKAISK